MCHPKHEGILHQLVELHHIPPFPQHIIAAEMITLRRLMRCIFLYDKFHVLI